MTTRSPSLKLLTNSRKRCFRRCNRLHHLQYDLGYRPVAKSEALRFGALGHDALEIWWVEHITDAGLRDQHWRRIWARRGVAVEGMARAEWVPDPLGCALDAIDADIADPFMKARARAAIRGYDRKWGPVASRYRVMSVEHEFAIPLINPATKRASKVWLSAGKMDVLVNDLEARVVMPIEHKFTARDISEGSRYWKRLRMDSQLSTYIAGASVSAGVNIDRALYDVIKRPDQRQLRATPVDERKYTQPKTKLCPECKKKTPATPAPHSFPVDDERKTVECIDDPEGRGKRIVVTDPGGKLYATMRETDETVEEFEARVDKVIADRENEFYLRDVVTRTPAEIFDAMADDWVDAKRMHAAAIDPRLATRNVDACDGDDGSCAFLDACYGLDVLNDPNQFRKTDQVHEELFDLSEPPMHDDQPTVTDEESPL